MIDAGASLRIELFGNLQVICGGKPLASINTNRLQSLLALLVLNGDAPQSREQLAFLLWPDSAESQARTNLRQLLHHLRRALPAQYDCLVADNHTVQWRRDSACAVDVYEFEAAVARGELEKAAVLYQDDLLRGLYDDWLAQKREAYRQQLDAVLRSLIGQCEAREDYTAAIRYAERLVAHDSLREAHHQTLIRLHADNNDRASAVRAYHQCMRMLRRELGVEPDVATRALFEKTLQKKPSKGMDARRSATSKASSLIGRAAERKRLLDCWQQAVAGQTQLAFISGEPGIGKSRLADEVVEECLRGGAAVARGRCYAAHGQLAYAPITDWLRAEPLRAARSLLTQSQLGELARVLPEILSEHPGLQRPRAMTESWERHHFYESVCAVFAKAERPLLLTIDDLQWCDSDSLEWMHSLFRSEAACGIFVLGTIRQEEIGREHPVTRLRSELRLAGKVAEIALNALSSEETAALATQVAGRQLEASALDGLYRATRGNPLFVVESVRAGGASNPAVALSGKVQAVIAGRLAQLSGSAYELAGMASAVGQSFSFELLARATDWDEVSVSKALDELWQRRLVESSAGLYDFTHDRLREVAYGELSPVRKRFLHHRIARAVEELHAGDLSSVSGQLAAHYAAASMAEEAVQYYRNAAAVARQRYADIEAAELLRKALTLCRTCPESAAGEERELSLLVELGPVLVTTHGYSNPEVGESYGRALVLSQRIGKPEYFLPVLSGIWVFHLVSGDLEKSRELGEQFLTLGAKFGLSGLAAAGHFVLCSSLFHLGAFALAKQHAVCLLAADDESSRAALKLFAGPDVRVFCHSYMAHIEWHLGNHEQAMASVRDAWQAAEAVAHPFAKAIAMDYAALFFLFRREASSALHWAEEAATVCRKHGFIYYLMVAEMVAGWAIAMEGDVTAGLKRLREGVQGFRALGAEIRLPLYYGLIAEVCTLAGRSGEASAHLSNAFAFESKNGEVWAADYLRRIYGATAPQNAQISDGRTL